MENKTMDEKKIYEKPTCMVINLQHHTNLLVGSSESPDAPVFGDWLG